MNNPIQFVTEKGMQVWGSLLRGWSTGSAALPGGAVETDGNIRLETGALVKFLASAPYNLVQGTDFEIRPNITHFELIRRDETVASMLLPEKDVIERLASGEISEISMPTFYAKSGFMREGLGALYTIPLPDGDARFDEFLDLHMGYYSGTQCA
jgi:hypothetical protein